MRILMIGAGGVGDAAAKIAVERDFFDVFVVADYDIERARRALPRSCRPKMSGISTFSSAERVGTRWCIWTCLMRWTRALS